MLIYDIIRILNLGKWKKKGLVVVMTRISLAIPLFLMPHLEIRGEEPDTKTDGGFYTAFIEYQQLQDNLNAYSKEESKEEERRLWQMAQEAIAIAHIRYSIARRHRGLR